MQEGDQAALVEVVERRDPGQCGVCGGQHVAGHFGAAPLVLARIPLELVGGDHPFAPCGDEQAFHELARAAVLAAVF